MATLLVLLAVGTAHAQGCGEVLSVTTATAGELRAAFVPPARTPATTLLLLPGGDGHAALDSTGCPQRLQGNSLIRSMPLFQAAGLGTLLVDAPARHQGGDGLGAYRTDVDHAADLGRLITAVRERTGGTVWVAGTSRGAISAANAAARLQGRAAPDGVVLTSAVVAGDPRARKPWVAQSVFDLPLQAIVQPLLVIGHAQDRCLRSPPTEMDRVVSSTRSARAQAVTVRGGAVDEGAARVDACEGRSAHGFIGQEAEVADGIVRFVRGQRY
jgi:pimeloyl-ACP methyl ester carboxylesterase